MPRPKVRPEDRRRSVRACDTCKHLKKRCDSLQPCTPCTKKGISESCGYSEKSRRRLDRPFSPPQSSTRKHEARSDSSFSLAPSSSAAQLSHEIAAFEDARDNTRDDTRENTPAPYVGQKPVMLFSSTGEKVFVGNTAALSFHQFLRKILKRYAGPSSFTEGQQSRRMLEVDIPDSEAEVFRDDLVEEEKRALIQCFLDASCGLLDLFTQAEIEQLISLALHARENGLSGIRSTHKEDLSSFYTMIAIGAQCRGRDDDERVTAARYFSKARQLAFESMLQDPTTNMARAFLLMAFFMFGACRRNTAFMFIGVASKAAVVLGLHVSGQYKYLSPEERDMRLRTGKSIRALDLVCSSILGRPGSTLSLRTDDVFASDLRPESTGHRAVALSATYEASTVLESIVHKAAQDSNMDAGTAENFLQMLREWSQALPPVLRQRPRKNSVPLGPTYREASIGNIHVACTYYFGVILTTRHFLIQHTMPLLRKPPQKGGPEDKSHATRESGKVAEMAHVCIEAAVYMAQMCSEAVDVGVLLGNMCILKAWIFAAGLVLGFCLLSGDASNTQARDAFNGSRRVLAWLGRLSPQATQYHEILTSFSDAIETYQAKLARDQQRSKVPLVERILSLDPADDVHDQQGSISSMLGTIDTTLSMPETQDSEATPASWSDILGTQSLLNFPMPSGEDEVMLNLFWDGYAMNFGEPGPQ
ncbi:putative Zn(2)-C6 fungal-type domain-containing protein [Seiridium cardinale]